MCGKLGTLKHMVIIYRSRKRKEKHKIIMYDAPPSSLIDSTSSPNVKTMDG
jgi:hypothetical protein